MIDFKNPVFAKLRPFDEKYFYNIVCPMFTPGEEILCCYQGIRDGIVFTNKRIISINVQGVTGKKKDCTSLPYSKIQAFSVESSGVLDNDCELDLWYSGLGNVRFEFTKTINVFEICKLISERVL